MPDIIKNTNYGSAFGRLDPSVLKRTKLKAPISDKTVKKPIHVSDFDILKLRSAMGGNNLDLTTTNIEEKDIAIPGNNRYLLARLYTPSKSKKHDNCLLYLHGGGFIGGSIITMNNQCRLLAERANVLVISLDYRLAPETRFPGQYYDVKESIDWITQNHNKLGFSASQIYVAGDSAGANLAIACGLTDTENKIKHIFSLYGALDFTSIDETIYGWDYSKYQMSEREEKFIHTRLNKFAILSQLIQKLYVGDAANEDPLISPVYAKDFNKMPSLTLIEAEFDYFLLSNKYFAQKAKSKGVKVEEVLYKGLDHGFFDRLGSLSQVEDAVNLIAKEINS